MKTKFDIWKDKWDDLDESSQLSIYGEFLSDCRPDDQFYTFDEDFFQTYFENDVIGAVRAVHFGDIKNWSDDYIRFDGYANLESCNASDLISEAESDLSEIYDHESCWRHQIDESDIDDELRELCLDEVKENVLLELKDLDPDLIEDEFDNRWEEDSDLEQLSIEIIDYFNDPENR